MADGEPPLRFVDADDPNEGVVAFLQERMQSPGRPCDGCNRQIVPGQHYLRLAVIFDTAGMEVSTMLRLPDGVMWSRIFDDPACAGLALILAGERDPLFTDVFRR